MAKIIFVDLPAGNGEGATAFRAARGATSLCRSLLVGIAAFTVTALAIAVGIAPLA